MGKVQGLWMMGLDREMRHDLCLSELFLYKC